MITKIKKQRKTDKVFQRFADEADIVYFGKLEEEDDIDPVRGITFYRDRKDRNYMHGTIHERDVTVLQRTVTRTIFKPQPEEYTWTIVNVGLREPTPDMFVDAHHYDKQMYKNIFAKFARLRFSNSLLSSLNHSFTDHFQVFMPSEEVQHTEHYFNQIVMQTMLQQFPNFDVEITRNDLLVYFNDVPDRPEIIHQMVAEATWLANHFEYTRAYMDQLATQNSQSLNFVAA